MNASDDGVIRLLAHYSEYSRDFDDFWSVESERSVRNFARLHLATHCDS